MLALKPVEPMRLAAGMPQHPGFRQPLRAAAWIP